MAFFLIEGAMKESPFSILFVFLTEKVNFRQLLFALKLFRKTDSKNLMKELRHRLSKYLKAIEFIE